MADSPNIVPRLKTLIEAARSQKEVARAAKVSDGTLINWLRGLGLRESKLREVARNLHVSLLWLRDGVGDEEAELAAFQAHLRSGAGDTAATAGPRWELVRARERAGLTLVELAKRIGHPVMILDLLEKGSIRASEKLIDILCRELPGLSKDDLILASDHPRIMDETGVVATVGSEATMVLPPGVKGRYVPLLSLAQAGQWDAGHSDSYYQYDSVFALNVDDRRAFAIKVSGNSMEPSLHEGDMVICSPQHEPQNGDAVVVRTRSENVFIKFWRKRGERVLLESANPDYKPLEFPVDEILGAWPIVQTVTAGKVKKPN